MEYTNTPGISMEISSTLSCSNADTLFSIKSLLMRIVLPKSCQIKKHIMEYTNTPGISMEISSTLSCSNADKLFSIKSLLMRIVLPKSCQIKKHINRLLGHILRMPQEHIPIVATEMDTHRKRVKMSSQDYMDNIYYNRTVRYGSDYGGSSSDRSRP